LAYNWHRYYAPELGRYLQPDPLGLASGDTNLYDYVRNNPTRLTDPDGRNPLLLMGAGAVVGAAARVYSNYDTYQGGTLSGWDLARSALFSAGTGALAALPSGIVASGLAAGSAAFANNLFDQSTRPGCRGLDLKKAGVAAAIGAGGGALSGLGGELGENILRLPPVIGDVLPGTAGSPSPLATFAAHGGILGNALGTAAGAYQQR
jgi:uncharacterized protein RhaS with RHS repeats